MFLKDLLQITTERVYTDEGYLKVPARISRIGIQEYSALEMGVENADPSKKIRIYRPPEEVFAMESMVSFVEKPVTNDHPPELVNIANYKKYSVGMSGANVTNDGMFVKTNLTITDAEAIKAIETGKVELSNGYTADIDWTPGITEDGESYDAIQRNIKGNHIAIVTKGRAGAEVKVADNLPQPKNEDVMKITIDGVDYEVSDQAAQAVGKLQKQLRDSEESMKSKEDEMEAKKKEDEEEMEKAKAEKDSMKEKMDAALAQVPNTEKLDSMLADRMVLVDSAVKVMPELKWKGKDAATIKKEVVAYKCQNVQLDSVSSDYINARFDILVEDSANSNNLDEALKQQVNDKGEVVDTRPLSVIAREKMMKDAREAWKTGGQK